MTIRHFFRALLLGVSLLAGAASVARAADLETRVREWQERHGAEMEKAGNLAQAGDVAAGNRILLDLADRDASSVAAFTVANMLYRIDPAVSYRLHERALKAFPQEPAVHLEMAMEQHRKGEYAAAIANYQTAFAAGVGGEYVCLLADCLVRTGQLKEAVATWKSANHSANHTGIDFAIFEIYGPLIPSQRRGALLAKIKAGDTTLFGELLTLDGYYDTDWWNSSVNVPGLEADLKLAEKMLGAQDPRYRALAVYAGAIRPEEPKPEEIRQALLAAKLVLGPGATLPADSTLARALCENAVGHELVTPKELLAAHGPDLRARVARQDHAALHLLSWLTVQADPPQLAALDRLGWKEWHDPEFAVSYIAGRIEAGQITRPDDPELLAALAALPENNYLNRYRLKLVGQEHLTQDMIVAAIKAEYRELSSGLAMRDSYTLKGFFYLLAEQVDPTPKKPAAPAAKTTGT